MRTCENCRVESDTVEAFNCQAGFAPDGVELCADCTPSHRGCPECDPRDPYDN